MQPIQDKDLDKLFKKTFKEAELAPKNDLWANIATQLPEPKRKTKLPILWMAAASLSVIFTFGLFNKQDKIKLFNPHVEIDESFTISETQPLQSEFSENVQIAKVEPRESFSLPSPTATTEIASATLEPVNSKIPVATHKDPIAPVIVPLEVVSKPEPIPTIVESKTLKTEDSMASIEVVKEDRIRNVGDLVNFVVDKLDKREQKAIKFKTEDDESSIIGINVGFIKFNSKKHK